MGQSGKKGKKHIKPADFVYLGAVALMIALAVRYEHGNTADYEVALGDEVTFGSYLNEPITWRVLKLHEDRFGRASKAVLVSSEILAMPIMMTELFGVFPTKRH